MYNEECKVDVQHVCEEHINVPVVHHEYKIPPAEPLTAYGPPPPPPLEPLTAYGPPLEPLKAYAPPPPTYDPPAPPTLYGSPPPAPLLAPPPQPLFHPPEHFTDLPNIPTAHHQHKPLIDKSEKLVLHPSSLHYSTSFTARHKIIKRESESQVIFPQLGGVLLVDGVRSQRQEMLSQQQEQISDIVKVNAR